MSEKKKKKKRGFRFPVWAKTLTVLLLSVVTITVVAVVYSSNKLKNTTQEYYIKKSVEEADTLAIYLNLDDVKSFKNDVDAIYRTVPESEKVNNEDWDSPEREAYLAHFTSVLSSPAYSRLMNQVASFHRVNEAKWTYLAYADFEKERLIYLVDDADEEDRCLPGSFDDFTEQDMTVINHLSTGFEPEITNMPEYGYLASTGRPIYDGEDIVAFAFVDLSMDKVVAEQNKDAGTLTLILAALGLGVVAVGYLLVAFLIIRPIRILTRTANEYTAGSNEQLDKFTKVNIRTKDEIEDLTNSMKKMESDINRHIHDLLNAEKRADEMKTIADRDALTGTYNKRAYFEIEERLNEEIKNKKAKFSITMIDLNNLKVTNDTFGHERGDALIITMVSIIKNVFTKSPIYRVGGDEFVVVSEGEDYRNIKMLEKAFKEASVNVSAAIGVAVYDASLDNNVEDTFKRADRKMYEVKKKMKEQK